MDAEVAIVGGGPAACGAALALRAQGLSVAIIAAPSQAEKPTETASPQLKAILASIGAEKALSACEPCFGIGSSWGRSSVALQPSITNPLGPAWFIHRSQFDALLQDLARIAGTIWIDAKARDVVFQQSFGSIFTSSITIQAPWIVLATGSPVWPARVTGQKVLTSDSLFAFWARLPVEFEERLMFVEPADYGWWYFCPAAGKSAIACLVTDAASTRRLRPTQASNWNALFKMTDLNGISRSMRPATQINVARTGLAALPQKCGSHWVAIGDSALRLDPLGSSGTLTALDSGVRAARAVAQIFGGNASGLMQYEEWSNGLFDEFTRQRTQQYAMERSRRGNGFWSERLPGQNTVACVKERVVDRNGEAASKVHRENFPARYGTRPARSPAHANQPVKSHTTEVAIDEPPNGRAAVSRL